MGSVKDGVSMKRLSLPSLHSLLLCLLASAGAYHVVPFLHLSFRVSQPCGGPIEGSWVLCSSINVFPLLTAKHIKGQ